MTDNIKEQLKDRVMKDWTRDTEWLASVYDNYTINIMEYGALVDYVYEARDSKLYKIEMICKREY